LYQLKGKNRSSWSELLEEKTIKVTENLEAMEDGVQPSEPVYFDYSN
jgi:hypothetical protein